MAEIRKIPGFARRYMLGKLVWMVPAGLFFWLAFAGFSCNPGPQLWIGAAGFLVCIVCGIILEVLPLRRFRCPNCGRRIPHPHPKAGEPLQYSCSRCDVTWDTGLSESTD